MIEVEKLQNNYLDSLNKDYLYWKSVYEETNDKTALDVVNYIINCVNNFDDSYMDMIDQETRGFLHTILSRIRKYKDPFCDKFAGNNKLYFSEDDVLVAGFINHAKYVRGYVSEDKVSKFISDVKKSLINVDNKSVQFTERLRESQSRIKPIIKEQEKIKVKKA